MSFNSRDFKGFTFRSGPVKKDTKQNSNFWWNNNDDVDVDDFLGIDTDVKKGKDLVALAGYRRAISNFVNIVTGENIPVTFNSNDESFTNGKKVVIGANIDDKKFDVAVGLALHEGSHIKMSDFDLLRNLEYNIPQEIYEVAEKVGVNRMTVISTIKNILNYVEDRRIDSFIFRTSPGYKNYYHAMYDKYFYSKNVDKGLLSSEYRTEEIDSYMFRIINLHNSNRQLTALKGLKEIYECIDLGRIQRGWMKDTNEAFNIACEVMSIILLNIDPIVVNDETGNSTDTDGDSEGEGGSGDGSSSGGNTITDEQLQDALDNGSVTPSENLSNDDGSDSVELSERQKGMLKKHFENDTKTTLAQETTGVPMFGKTRELDRPRYLAGLRNISFEGIRLLNKFFPVDYIIVVDLDLDGGWSYDGICHSFSYDNWSAMTANGMEYVDATYVSSNGDEFSEYKPLFYDTWAWRDIKTDMRNIPDSAEVNEFNFSRGDEPIEVNSNFNGLGIYKYEEAIDCKFDAVMNNDGSVVNEWAYFHNEMKIRGSRIFMNPSLITLYTPTIYSGKL